MSKKTKKLSKNQEKTIKYKDIDIKLARKCCKQHCYKNKHGMTIPNCDKCPLRRTNTNGRPGMCWYMIKSLHDGEEAKRKQCEYLEAEYNALMQEDVKEILEWENWVNSQESVD